MGKRSEVPVNERRDAAMVDTHRLLRSHAVIRLCPNGSVENHAVWCFRGAEGACLTSSRATSGRSWKDHALNHWGRMPCE